MNGHYKLLQHMHTLHTADVRLEKPTGFPHYYLTIKIVRPVYISAAVLTGIPHPHLTSVYFSFFLAKVEIKTNKKNHSYYWLHI